MKKYQIGGSMQSKTSDELNPYKIKTPVAPNPSFVPSGSMDRAQQGVETQKLSEDGNYIITTKNDTTTTKPNPYAVKAKEYADQKIKLNADYEYKLAKEKAKAKAKVKLAEYKGEISPMKKGGQVKKSKY